MLRTHKIRLNPNATQVQHLARACGVARFSWNWALARWQAQYEAHRQNPAAPKPNEMALRRELNALKHTEFPWMLEVTKCAPQESIINLGKAYKNWFSSLSGKRQGPKVQAPKFKKKGRRDSFKCSAGFFDVDGSRIRIPKLGWVRMRETLRFSGKLVSLTVSRTADAWFAAVTLETDETPARCESQAAVGVDLGIKALATFSDESIPERGPRALAGLLQRLRRLSRAHSRKQKGSVNRRKSVQRLARLHWHIANIRSNALHQLTHHLTSNYGFIAIEDLNVRGMHAGRLARHIADAGFGEFRRQLEYKAAQRGVVVEVVDRWYPSSKTCNACGAIRNALTLADRSWVCARCGAEHDRDLNAAKNILAEGIRSAAITVPGAGMSVCGEAGSGSQLKLRTKPVSTKQTVYA